MATVQQIFRIVAILLFLPKISHATETGAWEGTWKGNLDKHREVLIKIAGGRVITYALEGAPLEIQYSEITDATVSFGDQTHYAVALTRIGPFSASSVDHGRHGVTRVTLNRQ